MNGMIYLTTNFVDKNKMSWIDRIENIVEHNNDFTFNQKWLDEPIKVKSNEDKIFLLEKIKNNIKSSKDINFDHFADNFCVQFKNNVIIEDDQIDKKLSWSQIKSLKNSDIFSFGGHSHNHPILSFLTKDELSFELDKSLELIENKAKLKTIHYSYLKDY